MDYYSRIEKNQLPIYAIIWMNLRIIGCSERIQTKDYILYDFIYLKF